MGDLIPIIEGPVKFREGKKVRCLVQNRRNYRIKLVEIRRNIRQKVMCCARDVSRNSSEIITSEVEI